MEFLFKFLSEWSILKKSKSFFCKICLVNFPFLRLRTVSSSEISGRRALGIIAGSSSSISSDGEWFSLQEKNKSCKDKPSYVRPDSVEEILHEFHFVCCQLVEWYWVSAASIQGQLQYFWIIILTIQCIKNLSVRP